MSLFGKLKDVLLNTDANQFSTVIDESRRSHLEKSTYMWDIKVNTHPAYLEKVLTWSDKKKVDFIVWCVTEVYKARRDRTQYSTNELWYEQNAIRETYVTQVLKAKLDIDAEDLQKIIEAFSNNARWSTPSVMQWPLGLLINQLSRQYKNKEPGKEMEVILRDLIKTLKNTETYQEKDRIKLIEKIEQLVFKSANETGIKPVLFLGDDRFAKYANPQIESLAENERNIWYQVIGKAQSVNGAKPSQKYLNETKELLKQLGADKFKKTVNAWFDFLINLKDEISEQTQTYGKQTYTFTVTEYISAVNADVVKGLVWICSHFHDGATLNNITRLAERCYRKIPGKGPTATSLGNACLFQLYNSKGLDGIGHLSRLKLRIKQNNTQNIIEKYIQSAAEKEGVTTHEIEDMAVDNFDLVNGEREYLFENYTCKLKVLRVGKSELEWYKPDGTPQKTVPGFIKEKHAAKLKKIKETQKLVDLTTSIQRDRIDRMFRSGRKINIENFDRYYLQHGLMNVIAKKIIWTFIKDKKSISAIYIGSLWLTYEDKEINPKDYDSVLLWHPAQHSLNEVKQWRQFLTARQVQQPLKQAYREVYILTDAEINTKTYSNRMAAHVLKQHQFNSLAKSRGWKYSLLGAYDDGRSNEAASIYLPEYGLRAEFWVNELNVENEYNDTGIWNYIATDQIRFVNTTTNEPIELVDIDTLAFSEILRDVDLFVGVGSVGNDPMWRDSGGIPAYRDYWTSYSFGDLSEVGKNRKEILTGLVPRLKISKVSEIKDKFLVVKGKLRTYKIHIGSTNILMEPNDQYLCIVPDRSQKNHTENLFIPFEGDAGLSVILSKAFLLADDDKITDTTITSQINRR